MGLYYYSVCHDCKVYVEHGKLGNIDEINERAEVWKDKHLNHNVEFHNENGGNQRFDDIISDMTEYKEALKP